MPTVTIWHNPRCTKSRATLSLLEQHGLHPVIIEYLKTPPNVEELKSALKKLRLTAREFVRKGEDVYKELGLADAGEDKLIAAMVANPILIERPVVLYGRRAAIGRPPEDVLDLFTDL